VDDIEALRRHLGVERWQVFGGSWGSTLALAYAQAHPARVTELVLRGIFLLRAPELRWYYQGDGAEFIFPDYWEDFVRPVPVAERGDMISAYHKLLTGDDAAKREAAAAAWTRWEMATSSLSVKAEDVARCACCVLGRCNFVRCGHA
jgi:proline iminopeptidase